MSCRHKRRLEIPASTRDTIEQFTTGELVADASSEVCGNRRNRRQATRSRGRDAASSTGDDVLVIRTQDAGPKVIDLTEIACQANTSVPTTDNNSTTDTPPSKRVRTEPHGRHDGTGTTKEGRLQQFEKESGRHKTDELVTPAVETGKVERSVDEEEVIVLSSSEEELIALRDALCNVSDESGDSESPNRTNSVVILDLTKDGQCEQFWIDLTDSEDVKAQDEASSHSVCTSSSQVSKMPPNSASSHQPPENPTMSSENSQNIEPVKTAMHSSFSAGRSTGRNGAASFQPSLQTAIPQQIYHFSTGFRYTPCPIAKHKKKRKVKRSRRRAGRLARERCHQRQLRDLDRVEADRQLYAELDAEISRQPSVEDLQRRKAIVFVDLDNWSRLFDRLSCALPSGVFVWAFYGGQCNWNPPIRSEHFMHLVAQKGFYLHPKCGTSKDAADFALCMQAGVIHAGLPTSIPFVVLSGDKGFEELQRQLQQGERAREAHFINPHQVCPNRLSQLLSRLVHRQ